ncbi:AGE family epimerase/isomerase [Gleimia hominis]|uniref:AGE family epimerase/isomerase n=1 Tax=Gleimia hominis TaxID=595468 RepID=A0ABU3I953_9ACTO|nr:AGE family epimerase/isomerase [Gleimia hominis]MDT3766907.1 AGE family epimerase/isomerase [Gleimia hominis]
MSWLDSIEHNRWLSKHLQALVETGRSAMVPTGFGMLNPDGSIDKTRPVDLAATARFTYVFCLATELGIPGSRKYADHGVRCLRKYFKDPEFDGWFFAIEHQPDADGNGVPHGEDGAWKRQYSNAFLLLAAASATVANRPGGNELLLEAMRDQEAHWWDETVDRVRARYNRDYSELADYRGMDSNLHTTEAYLAVAEVMDDPVWIDRATAILRFVYEEASNNDWRVGEHYDSNWEPLRNYPGHSRGVQHFPNAVVIGHQMEWARLAVHVRAANKTIGRTSPDWLLELSQEMFERARVDGWRRNGKPGFVYSVDFEGNVVDASRMQWIVSEGIAATIALRQAVLDDGGSIGSVEHYDHHYRSWLDYVEEYVIEQPGYWHRCLSEDNEVTESYLPGLKDNYHAVQALLMPRLPLWPPFAAAISRGLLDKPHQPEREAKGWRLGRRR